MMVQRHVSCIPGRSRLKVEKQRAARSPSPNGVIYGTRARALESGYFPFPHNQEYTDVLWEADLGLPGINRQVFLVSILSFRGRPPGLEHWLPMFIIYRLSDPGQRTFLICVHLGELL